MRVRRRRRRTPLHRRVLRAAIRVILIVAIAIALLMLMAETAHAAPPTGVPPAAGVDPTRVSAPSPPQTPSEQTPSEQPAGGQREQVSEQQPEPAATSERRARPSAGTSPPTTIEEWVRELQRRRDERASGAEPAKPSGRPSARPQVESDPKSPRSEPALESTAPAPAPLMPSPVDRVVAKPIVAGGAQSSPPRAGTPRAGSPPAPSPGVDGLPGGPPPAPARGPRPYEGRRRLGEIPDGELRWTRTIDLIYSLELEFADLPPAIDLSILEHHLYHHLIALSAQLGHTDNPRDNLEGLRQYIQRTMQLTAVDRPRAELELLLPRSVLPAQRGSPLGVGLWILALADRVNPYLDLEPILAGDILAFRYRSGDHRYSIIPRRLDRLYTDSGVADLAFGPQSDREDAIRVLTRRQFWGMVIGEAGAALLETGESGRAGVLLRRALSIFPDQALPRVALARLELEQRDAASAREELDRAVELAPRSVEARLRRVEVLELLGDVDTLESDLHWLAHAGNHPWSAVRLIRLYLQRQSFERAAAELARLRERELTPSLKREVERLASEVGAAPWVARLRESATAADRFRAIDELSQYRLPGVYLALADVLGDENIRLAHYAHRALRRMTGLALPRDAAAWRAALARQRDAAAPPRR